MTTYADAIAGTSSPVAWYAPGIGEVHEDTHCKMIYCYKAYEGDETEPDEIVDDELAKQVCAAMNAYQKTPNPELEQALVALAKVIEANRYIDSDQNAVNFIDEHGPTILKALERAK